MRSNSDKENAAELLSLVLSDENDRLIFRPYSSEIIDHVQWLSANLAFEHSYSLVWIDRYRSIGNKRELFHAFDASLRWYAGDWGSYNWQHFLEQLTHRSNLPSNGCVLMLSDLSSLALSEPKTLKTLVSILEEAREHWSAIEDYHFRVVLEMEEPSNIPPWV